MDAGQFRQQAREQGYGEAQPLEIEPNVKREMHAHDATCFVLVLEGQLSMLTERGAETFGTGDTCVMPSGAVHAEQTGPGGIKGLIARK
jgi:quercetin dioxygenase-like cupin family protein